MTPVEQILLVPIMISWGLACYHAIMAYRKSPEASAFRPFWKNRYSPAGQHHRRRLIIWMALAGIVVLALLYRH